MTEDKRGNDKKITNEKWISLYPIPFDEELKYLLAVKPSHKKSAKKKAENESHDK